MYACVYRIYRAVHETRRKRLLNCFEYATYERKLHVRRAKSKLKKKNRIIVFIFAVLSTDDEIQLYIVILKRDKISELFVSTLPTQVNFRFATVRSTRRNTVFVDDTPKFKLYRFH